MAGSRVACGRRTAPLKLEQFLPYQLNVLSSLVSQALSRVYARRYGIGVPEWRVLVTLGQYGVMTGKAIGAHTHMHKTKVSRAVALLEKRKLAHAARQPRRHARGVSVADRPPAARSTRSWRRTRSISPAGSPKSSRPTDRDAFDRALQQITDRSAQLVAEADPSEDGPMEDT